MASKKVNIFKRKVVNLFSSRFSKRIHARINTFYRRPEIRSTLKRKLDSTDSIEVWKDSPYWQFQLNNKLNSREFAKKYSCKVPKLYWKGRDVENIDFNLLPENYVIKPNIGYSAKMVFLMQGSRNLFNDENYKQNDIIEELSKIVAENPEIEFIIEEFAANEKGEYLIPDDYKIYSFNGEIACIQVINRTGRSIGSTSFYDEHWNKIDRVQKHYLDAPRQPAPLYLREMVQQAKRLSKVYKIFVRIDFYATQKGAVFGEFTPTPFRGNDFTSFGKKLLLSHWDKYCRGMY